MKCIQIRASSLSDLFDCPSRWEARNIRKLTLPRSGAAQLGTAVHAGTAAFDTCRLNGNPITPDEAAGAVVDAIHRPEEDVDWGDDSPQDAETIGIALHKLYCATVAPTLEYIAVEATCERLDLEDIGISLTGTTDRVFVSADGDFGIADIKTGKTAVSSDGTVKTQMHAAQLAVYELLASTALQRQMNAPALIVGLQVAKTDKGRRVATGAVSGARDLLLGDEYTPGLLEHAAGILQSGAFHGNPRSMLCTEKYCPAFHGCRWRK